MKCSEVIIETKSSPESRVKLGWGSASHMLFGSVSSYSETKEMAEMKREKYILRS